MTTEEKEAIKENPVSVLDRAEIIAKQLEEANKKSEELLKQNQELMARMILGGKTEAGIQTIPEPVISPQEFAKKVMNGEVNLYG